MNERIKTMLIALTGGLFSAIVVLGVSAIADSKPSTDDVPKLIPYNGTLEKDGHGVNGDVNLHFRIFDGKDAPDPVWEEQLSVHVYNGRFTALLGSSSADSSTNLTKVINNADDLYLGIGVVTSSGEVKLSNKQRFLPVPYAMWTTASTDFKVGHDLTVDHNISAGGDANISGKLSVGGDASVTGKLDVTDNTTLGKDLTVGHHLTINGTDLMFGNYPGRGDGGRALVHHNNDTLVINFGKDFSGGVRIEGDVKMEGNVKMEGTVSTSQPLIKMKYFYSPKDVYDIDTNFDTSKWNCFIGGVYYGEGDIDEHWRGDDVAKFYTYPGYNGHWYIKVYFDTEGHHEDHKVGVVCVRTGISSRDSWFSE